MKETDLRHLWHPFTQQRLWFESEPLIVERAEGVELIDLEGRRYLDGVSSLWCNVHGHGVPELVGAIKSQAERVCHSTLLGLSHVPILELTEKLLSVVSPHFSRAFYSDSGSAAAEAAMRMALEWWQKQAGFAAKKRTHFASLLYGYDGDTLGAVGVGYVPQFHRALESNIVKSLTVSSPHYLRFYKSYSAADSLDRAVSEVDALLRRDGASIAAFILEPLVQGAAGIWTYEREYLTAVCDLCRQHDVLVIVDEVATGFGKTGRMFAHQHTGVKPDLLVLGKGLSGGYLPISAVVTTEKIFEGFLGRVEEFKTFFFGQTFAGNPLAAAAAKASLELFESRKVFDVLPGRIEHLRQELDAKIAPLAHVDEVRSLGLMVGIELTKSKGSHSPYPPERLASWGIVARARELGAAIRPLGNVIVLMPALAMEERDITRLVEITADAIKGELGE